jgi:hypothetical protein
MYERLVELSVERDDRIVFSIPGRFDFTGDMGSRPECGLVEQDDFWLVGQHVQTQTLLLTA